MKIAWIQFDIVWQDPKANFEKIDKILSDSSYDFDLLVLPEMFDTGFCMDPTELATRDQDLVISWLKKTSVNHNSAIIASTIFQENDQFYNRSFFIENNNVQHYNKNYLFNLSGENVAYTAGTESLIVEHENFTIQPLICYDLRFPEISRNTKKLSLLCYSANWPESRSDQWYYLLKARAIENQCYVLGVNRLGSDGNDFNFVGRSVLFSFDGTEIQNSLNQESLFVENIDLDSLRNYQSKLPFLQDIKS